MGSERLVPASGLAFSNIAVDFGGVRALQGVSGQVKVGDFAAVVGPNGAGKTTFLNAVNGFLSNVSGRTTFNELTLSGRSPVAVARAGVARSFQHPRLLESESVLYNVLCGAHLRLEYSLSAQIARLRKVRDVERVARSEALDLLSDVGLEDRVDDPVSELPFGAKKLVDLVRALMQKPDLLLLDEPTSGMDTQEQAVVNEMLRNLRQPRRLTALIVEHHMDVVRHVADYVFGLHAGAVLATGTPEEVLNSDTYRAAMIGGMNTPQNVQTSPQEVC